MMVSRELPGVDCRRSTIDLAGLRLSTTCRDVARRLISSQYLYINILFMHERSVAQKPRDALSSNKHCLARSKIAKPAREVKGLDMPVVTRWKSAKVQEPMAVTSWDAFVPEQKLAALHKY